MYTNMRRRFELDRVRPQVSQVCSLNRRPKITRASQLLLSSTAAATLMVRLVHGIRPRHPYIHVHVYLMLVCCCCWCSTPPGDKSRLRHRHASLVGLGKERRQSAVCFCVQISPVLFAALASTSHDFGKVACLLRLGERALGLIGCGEEAASSEASRREIFAFERS